MSASDSANTISPQDSAPGPATGWIGNLELLKRIATSGYGIPPEVMQTSSVLPSVSWLSPDPAAYILQALGGKPPEIAPKQPTGPIMEVLGKWSGVVTEIGQDSFVAELHGTYGAATNVVAEFDIEDDVDEDDRNLVQEGAYLYVMAGRLRERGGRTTKVISLRFRRLPPWSQGDLEFLAARARKRMLLMGVSDADRPSIID